MQFLLALCFFLSFVLLRGQDEGEYEYHDSPIPERRWIAYTTKPGDTMEEIAEYFYNDKAFVEMLLELNLDRWSHHSTPPWPTDTLETGVTIRIPLKCMNFFACPYENPRIPSYINLNSKDVRIQGDGGSVDTRT